MTPQIDGDGDDDELVTDEEILAAARRDDEQLDATRNRILHDRRAAKQVQSYRDLADARANAMDLLTNWLDRVFPSSFPLHALCTTGCNGAVC